MAAHSTEIIKSDEIVTSKEEGDWKKVKEIQYNSVSEKIKVSYEE